MKVKPWWLRDHCGNQAAKASRGEIPVWTIPEDLRWMTEAGKKGKGKKK